MSVTIKGQTPREYDQFFTTDQIAKSCVDILQGELLFPISKFDVVLEPSCGQGAFVKALPSDNLIYMDIDAADDNIQNDFLTTDVMNLQRCLHSLQSTPRQTCLTVGNPPFGKNSTVAIQFFNRATLFSDVIAFIVPKTFCKSSTKDRLDRAFFLIKETEIKPDSFIFAGKITNVPCVFQIWCHHASVSMVHTNIKLPDDKLRELTRRLSDTDDFKFVKVNESPDLIIRRVGVLAGRIYTTDLHKWITPNHYFIQVRDRDRVAEITQRLISLNLESLPSKFAVAGMPSISITELCMEYNKKYKN